MNGSLWLTDLQTPSERLLGYRLVHAGQFPLVLKPLPCIHQWLEGRVRKIWGRMYVWNVDPDAADEVSRLISVGD